MKTSTKYEYSPVVFQQQLMALSRELLVTCIICGGITYTSLANGLTHPKGIQQVQLYLCGLLASYAGYKSGCRWVDINDIRFDLEMVNRRETPPMHRAAITEPKQIGAEIEFDDDWIEKNLIQDFMTYWLAAGAVKHLLIVAGTGDGKSTFLKSGVVPRLNDWMGGNWTVKAYDVDATNFDYAVGIEVLTEYSDIGAAMANDMEELERRVQIRKVQGDRFNEQPQLIIGEELPALVAEIPIEKEWLPKIAKRGRKVHLWTAIVAQNDTVKNLGTEGDSDMKTSCFVVIYAGSKAVARAKALKNDVLVEWLVERPHGRYLVDDLPMEWVLDKPRPQLPSTPRKELEGITPPSALTSNNRKEPEGRNLDTSSDYAVSPSTPSTPSLFPDITDNQYNLVMKLKREGLSTDKIIQTIFSTSGGRKYIKIRPQVEAVINEYNSNKKLFDEMLDNLGEWEYEDNVK